jgi:DNA-binding beta-propeller fold protein YncE
MRCASARRFAIAATALAALLAPAAAQAKQVYPFLETFGSSQQPSLAEPSALAVDQATGDLYVIEGRDEVQQLTVSATAGKFVLRFEGHATSELAFNATRGAIQTALQNALQNAICEGTSCVGIGILNTPEPGTYTVTYRGPLAGADVPPLECEDGSPPLSGGSGCAVETTTQGVNGAVRRFKPNGEPDPFSALGSNAIDGRGAEDETPQGPLVFDPSALPGQVAVDDSCAQHEPPLTGTECEELDPANGDVYVSQAFRKLVDVFSPAGKYLGQLTGFVGNEEQKLEFASFSNLDEFVLSNLPAPCAQSQTEPIVFPTPNSIRLSPSIAPALAAACGPDIVVGFNPNLANRVDVTFTGTFGETNQPLLSCAAVTGSGSCFATTLADGGVLRPLGQMSGVAVDAEGDAYVGDFNYGIHEYAQPGVPHNPLEDADFARNCSSLGRSASLALGAGPTAGSLFAILPNQALYKIDTASCAIQYGGEPIVEGASGNSAPTTVAVDPSTGRVFVAREAKVEEYDASEAAEPHLISTIEVPSKVAGVAVEGSTHRVYLAREGLDEIAVYGPPVTVPDVAAKPASGIGARLATLNGELSAAGGPEAHCRFQYLSRAAYLAQKEAAEAPHDKNTEEVEDAAFAGAEVAPCQPEGPFEGGESHAVSGQATGLDPETAYAFRLLGESENGQSPSQALVFTTQGKPRIEVARAGEITPDSALLAAEVDSSGLPTTLAAQYVSEAAYAESGYTHATTLPAEPVGEAPGFAEVTRPLAGLAPATAYRFRLIATNEIGATTVEGTPFATYPIATGLLDGRAYEMVTPPAKQGEPFAAEARGSLGGSCASCLSGSDSAKMPMQAAPGGDAIVFEGQPFGPGLASGQVEYLGTRGGGGWATLGLSLPQYNSANINGLLGEGFQAFSADLSRAVIAQIEPPLSPAAPSREGKGFSDLYLWQPGPRLTPLITTAPPTREPGVGEEGSGKFFAIYAGADASFDRVVLAANDSLTGPSATAPAAPAVGPEEFDLYQWHEGQLSLVNVLPGNAAAAPNATIGSGHLLDPQSVGFRNGPAIDRAVSADGSHVYWTDLATEALYVRIDGGETKEVEDPGRFLTASADGSRALLSDGCLYSLATESCEDLTSGEGGFEGILGASEDLARVYFVDTKALPGSGPNERGEEAQAGKANLYLWQGGAPVFVARLLNGPNPAPSDNEIAGSKRFGDWKPSPTYRTAQVSPDGRYLAFMSRAELTGQGNVGLCDVESIGEGKYVPSDGPCNEVFTYDAATGRLRCPSCNPTGARPLGGSNLTLVDNAIEYTIFPQPHNLVASGRLFFESMDKLSPRDQNGRIKDVYEWEPKGVGSCDSEAKEGGCLELVSSGQSPNDSLFVNATPSGSDAFFVTRRRLLARDKDELMDLYDARVGGGFEEAESTPCEGEACRGPSPQPPATLPGAASAAFAGPGNARPAAPRSRCKKGRVRRKGRCVRRRHRHRSRKRHRRKRHGKRRAHR